MKTERVVVEPWVGGRIFETMSDGSEGSWGTILAWEAAASPGDGVEAEPHGAAAHRGRDPVHRTGRRGTRVDLEHRGWERLGELAQQGRGEYAGGWTLVFEERFAAAANGAA